MGNNFKKFVVGKRYTVNEVKDTLGVFKSSGTISFTGASLTERKEYIESIQNFYFRLYYKEFNGNVCMWSPSYLPLKNFNGMAVIEGGFSGIGILYGITKEVMDSNEILLEYVGEKGLTEIELHYLCNCATLSAQLRSKYIKLYSKFHELESAGGSGMDYVNYQIENKDKVESIITQINKTTEKLASFYHMLKITGTGEVERESINTDFTYLYEDKILSRIKNIEDKYRKEKEAEKQKKEAEKQKKEAEKQKRFKLEMERHCKLHSVTSLDEAYNTSLSRRQAFTFLTTCYKPFIQNLLGDKLIYGIGKFKVNECSTAEFICSFNEANLYNKSEFYERLHSDTNKDSSFFITNEQRSVFLYSGPALYYGYTSRRRTLTIYILNTLYLTKDEFNTLNLYPQYPLFPGSTAFQNFTYFNKEKGFNIVSHTARHTIGVDVKKNKEANTDYYQLNTLEALVPKLQHPTNNYDILHTYLCILQGLHPSFKLPETFEEFQKYYRRSAKWLN